MKYSLDCSKVRASLWGPANDCKKEISNAERVAFGPRARGGSKGVCCPSGGSAAFRGGGESTRYHQGIRRRDGCCRTIARRPVQPDDRVKYRHWDANIIRRDEEGRSGATLSFRDDHILRGCGTTSQPDRQTIVPTSTRRDNCRTGWQDCPSPFRIATQRTHWLPAEVLADHLRRNRRGRKEARSTPYTGGDL